MTELSRRSFLKLTSAGLALVAAAPLVRLAETISPLAHRAYLCVLDVLGSTDGPRVLTIARATTGATLFSAAIGPSGYFHWEAMPGYELVATPDQPFAMNVPPDVDLQANWFDECGNYFVSSPYGTTLVKKRWMALEHNIAIEEI